MLNFYLKQVKMKEDTRVIHIGGIDPFLLTVSSVELRHRVMGEHWDSHVAAFFHSSTSEMHGQTGRIPLR